MKRRRARRNLTPVKEAVFAEYERLRNMGLSGSTLRSLYYTLGGRGITRLNRDDYQIIVQLSKALRLEGRIEWGFFDEYVKGLGWQEVTTHPPSNIDVIVQVALDAVEHAREDAINSARSTSYHVERWAGQETLVELWLEKTGLIPKAVLWTSDLEVTIRTTSGRRVWESAYRAMQLIQTQLLLEPSFSNVVILYAGDLDPSGVGIPKHLRETVVPYFAKHLGIEQPIEIDHFALLPEHITKFGLPEDPEPEHLERALRDPNLKPFQERMGARFQLTELDALFADHETETRALLREKILEHFDEAIYRSMHEQETRGQEEIRRRIWAELGPPDDVEPQS